MYFFFFNDTATTEIYTLSLHDALPIYGKFTGKHTGAGGAVRQWPCGLTGVSGLVTACGSELRVTHKADRKSTRLNSSHANISYAVFCLKKKQNDTSQRQQPAGPALVRD